MKPVVFLMLFHFGMNQGLALEKPARKPSSEKSDACATAVNNARQMCTSALGGIPKTLAEGRLLVLDLLSGDPAQDEDSQVLTRQRNLATSCSAAVEHCRNQCKDSKIPMPLDCSEQGSLGQAQHHFQQAVLDLESMLKSGHPSADGSEQHREYSSIAPDVDKRAPGVRLNVDPDLQKKSLKVGVSFPLPVTPAGRPFQSAGAQ